MLTIRHLALLPFSPPPAALAGVTVSAFDDGQGGLRLVYRIAAESDAIVWPLAGESVRRDGLWQTTCCEIFLAPSARAAYREFNFSPSGAWAIYDFSGERQPLPAPDLPPPRIESRSGPGVFELLVHLPAAFLPERAAGQSLDLALTAVVDTAAHGPSYWALAHPGEKPDFHRRDTFTLVL